MSLVSCNVLNDFDQLNTEEFQKVLLSAWINFGAYLNQDGTQDGDINTLQHSGFRGEFLRDAATESMTVDEMKDIVTIETRPDPHNTLIHRAPTPRPVDYYDLEKAEIVSKVHELPLTLWDRAMMAECARLNAPQLAVFEQSWENDMSNGANALCNADWMITPLDIECLDKVVTEMHGQAEAVRMLTDVLGVNLRWKDDGRIRRSASMTPEVKWAEMVPPPRYVHDFKKLEKQILRFLKCPVVHRGIFPIREMPRLWTVRSIEHWHTAKIESIMLTMNGGLSDRKIGLESEFVIHQTPSRPQHPITAQHVSAMNWAKLLGGHRGYINCEYPQIAVAFQIYVEQNGAFYRMDWDSHNVDEGM